LGVQSKLWDPKLPLRNRESEHWYCYRELSAGAGGENTRRTLAWKEQSSGSVPPISGSASPEEASGGTGVWNKAWEVCNALVLKGKPVPEAETD
jgi:hypothetical protein